MKKIQGQQRSWR